MAARPSGLSTALLGAVLVSILACTGSDDRGAQASDAPAGAPAAALPDTSAGSLWAYLLAADYRANWPKWPGKGSFYRGTEPHGALLTTYLSPQAFEALSRGAAALPAGAIVVKDNFLPDSTHAGVTTMYKVAGYNAGHQDWFFAKHAPTGAVEAEGRVEGCITCHMGQAANDYIFTGELGPEAD